MWSSLDFERLSVFVAIEWAFKVFCLNADSFAVEAREEEKANREAVGDHQKSLDRTRTKLSALAVVKLSKRLKSDAQVTALCDARIAIVNELHDVKKTLRAAARASCTQAEARRLIVAAADQVKVLSRRARAVRLECRRRCRALVGLVHEAKGAHVQRRTAISRQSIVSVDLARYGKIASMLSSAMRTAGTSTLAKFNEELHALLDGALKATEKQGWHVKGALRSDTGDGAIVLIGDPAAAVHFAEEVVIRSSGENARRREPDARWFFRVGVRTGEVWYSEARVSGLGRLLIRMASESIGEAVRIQSGCPIGSVAICEDTWIGLPGDEVEREKLRKGLAGRAIRSEYARLGRVKLKDHEVGVIRIYGRKLGKAPKRPRKNT